mmetsp:Transcript_3225/g.7068  ORF Transcript_3225/g.7068 Transcript_3225/m.7068 type:complete len:214 (+) Transcript_3225:1156-1797(+)
MFVSQSNNLVIVITVIVVWIIVHSVVLGFFLYLVLQHLLAITLFIFKGHGVKLFSVFGAHFAPSLTNKFSHFSELDVWFLPLDNRAHFRGVKHERRCGSLGSIWILFLLAFPFSFFLGFLVACWGFIVLHLSFVSFLLIANLFLELGKLLLAQTFVFTRKEFRHLSKSRTRILFLHACSIFIAVDHKCTLWSFRLVGVLLRFLLADRIIDWLF